MKKRGILDFISKSFEGVVKNPIILLPGLIVMVLAWIGVFLATYARAEGVDYTNLILLVAVIALLAGFAILYFGLGGLGMAKEIVENRKAKWKNISQYWNKFWQKYLGAVVVLILVFAVLAAIIFGLINLLGYVLVEWPLFIASMLLVLIGGLIGILFLLLPYFVLVTNKDVKESLKSCIKFAKKNYFPLLLLLIVFFVLNMVLSRVPYIGSLLGIVISAAESIALMSFVIERK
ncbi:hypothetical protein ACFLZZ_04530 [Nanoarchaeota archaeon]